MWPNIEIKNVWDPEMSDSQRGCIVERTEKKLCDLMCCRVFGDAYREFLAYHKKSETDKLDVNQFEELLQEFRVKNPRYDTPNYISKE